MSLSRGCFAIYWKSETQTCGLYFHIADKYTASIVDALVYIGVVARELLINPSCANVGFIFEPLSHKLLIIIAAVAFFLLMNCS